MAGHISNDEFLTKLTQLYDTRRQKEHGSVYLTQKRLYPENDAKDPSETANDPLWDLNLAQPLPIIIRATDGKSKSTRDNKSKDDRVKFSTIVQPDALEGFFTRYGDVCKAGMTGLKKRDRSKRKKDKAKKKKAGAEGEKKG